MRPPTLPTQLKTKQDFYSVYLAGRLGNKLRTWDRLDQCPVGVLLMARFVGPSGGGPMLSDLTREEMRCAINRSGISPSKFRFHECAPDQETTLQGELCLISSLYVFAHERAAGDARLLRMRDVLPYAVETEGLRARLLLQRHCTPASYDDLLTLLELFPDHVIEFSAYRRTVGTLPQRNVIVWEVRQY